MLLVIGFGMFCRLLLLQCTCVCVGCQNISIVTWNDGSSEQRQQEEDDESDGEYANFKPLRWLLDSFLTRGCAESPKITVNKKGCRMSNQCVCRSYFLFCRDLSLDFQIMCQLGVCSLIVLCFSIIHTHISSRMLHPFT
jgi:hypothetical protein